MPSPNCSLHLGASYFKCLLHGSKQLFRRPSFNFHVAAAKLLMLRSTMLPAGQRKLLCYNLSVARFLSYKLPARPPGEEINSLRGFAPQCARTAAHMGNRQPGHKSSPQGHPAVLRGFAGRGRRCQGPGPSATLISQLWLREFSKFDHANVPNLARR